MNRSVTLPQRENLAALAAGILALAVYTTTLNPTVSFIDSGELAAAAVMLGIPHPTGYPLFTILGHLAAIVPLGGEPINRLNFAGALSVSASVVVFMKLVLFLQNAVVLFPARKLRLAPPLSLSSAFVGTLSFAFSATVWAQSVAIEVYSLHILFLVLVTFTFLKGMQLTVETATVSVHLLLFSFLLGLSFANHMTTILLAPAFIFLYFVTLRWKRESLILLGKLIPWFLLGLSAYCFLPFRSSQYPLLDWGHPAEFERLGWHISGKQYRSWIFSGFESAEKQLKYFFENTPLEFHWLLIVFILIGLWALFLHRRRLFAFLGLLIGGCLAYSINYDIHDIDAYFLLAYVAAGIAGVFGIAKVAALAGDWRANNLGRLRWVPLLFLPALQWWSNGPGVDEADNFLVRDYTRNILQGLDSNAVVLTFQWDYFVSASYYAQHVDNERPDVAIIDKELLRRSWYYIQLERNYPWLIERSRARIESFLRELSKFEHGLPYNGQVIEARFNEMINDMIDKSFEERPVYLGPELEPQFAPSFERVPDGLLVRLRKPGTTGPLREFDPFYRPTKFQSRLTRGLQTQYAQAFTFRAAWKIERGDLAGVPELLGRALSFDPGYIPALRLQEQLGSPNR